MTNTYISKLDVNGNFVWVKNLGEKLISTSYGPPGFAVESSGSVYAIGSDLNNPSFSFDPFIYKLDAGGNTVWSKKIADGTGQVHAGRLTIDASGNIYTTGGFNGTLDFDPGPGTTNLTSAGGYDIFILKLDALGGLAWAKRMGSGDADEGAYIALDGSRNIYTSGQFSGTVDFDPGPQVHNLTIVGTGHTFIHKLSQCTTPAQLAEQGCTGCGEIRLSTSPNSTAPNLDTEVKKNSAYASPNTLVWYADNNGSQGTQLNAAPTINTAIAGSQTFWVAQSAGASCTGAARKLVVSVASPGSPVLPISFCPGQKN
ncbi:MAG: hypothetical protein R3B47_13260 [Bacteroidia bacterium]